MFSTTKNRQTRTAGAVVGAAAAVIALTSTLGAGAAASGPLPGGSVKANLGGGTTMTARLVEEHVHRGAGNVANVPTSREVWVTGKLRVAVTGAAQGGIIKGGYVVGCQVQLAGVSNTGTGTATQSAVTAATAGSVLTLGPGQAAYVPIISQTNALLPGDSEMYRIDGYQFAGNRASVAYSQEPLRLNGCAGYAQARARMTIQVKTATTKSETVLWGKPFSIG